MDKITIENAYLNNLKNITLSIPKHKLVAVTGVSGSGKSSLIFDILFQEGRKRYLESIGMISRIDDEESFESIMGIGPTVAIKQSLIRQKNPRSVVGTRTRISNLLHLLFAYEGEIHCSNCGEIVDKHFQCPKCGNREEKVESSYFSFNSFEGMCLNCKGRGFIVKLNWNHLKPDHDTTLRQVLSNGGVLSTFKKKIKNAKNIFNFSLDTPFEQLSKEIQNFFIYGIQPGKKGRGRLSLVVQVKKKAKKEKYSDAVSRIECPKCQGYRIGDDAKRITLNNKHIGQLGYMTINELNKYLEDLKSLIISDFGKKLIKEIQNKLQHLVHVGLSYLNLYREIPTLSIGEMQRLFLMSYLNNEMDSLIYIFDEPSIGLHEIEKEDLINQIILLKNLGNSVIIIEHDKRIIEHAEHVIDIGPLAGIKGGEIVYQGDLNGLLLSNQSITGTYLSGRNAIQKKSVNNYLNTDISTKYLKIICASIHNLKRITAQIPLGMLVGISGVSGSGKSSLISDTLAPLLREFFKKIKNPDLNKQSIIKLKQKIKGVEYLDGFKEISQKQIGRHMNSNLMTYTKTWKYIRKLFASLPQSRQKGYSIGDFSFNSKGACPKCKGNGVNNIWLGKIYVSTRCPLCKGKRYQKEILKIQYKNRNISDILGLSVSEALYLFKEIHQVHSMLKILDGLGMGYIKLGQPLPTLSGGESQRIKLAKELWRQKRGKILYIFDEPTIGLSPYDIDKLLSIINQLIKKGNSIIIIEHDVDVLSYCDYIIELGPKGGPQGGEVIATGTPIQLSNNKESKIGPYLKVIFKLKFDMSN